MKRSIILMGLMALAMVSCVRDDGEANNGQGGKPRNGFTLSYSVRNSGSETVTRATIPPEEGEENVQDILLLFFNQTDDQSGYFQDYVIIEAPEGENLIMNDPINISYQGKSLNAGEPYNILAVANMSGADYIENGTIEDWATSWSGQTQYYVTEYAKAYAKEDVAITSNALLMSGSISLAANQEKVELSLVRGVVRFDVKTTISLKEDYDIVSVSIWNAYPQASIFDGSFLEYGDDVWRIKRFYGINNAGNYVTDNGGNVVNGTDGNPLVADIAGGLYSFVNRVGGPQQNDTRTTCLIIGLHERQASAGQVSYYRVNINPDDSGQSLKRNNAYKLTLRAVLGPGKDTEGEAYSGISSELEYTINYWDLDDNGLVVQDQNSVMSIPVKTARFGREGGTNEYTIYTFTTLTTNPVLTLTSQDYNISGRINARLEGNKLIITAEPLELGEEDRTGIITLRFAGLTATMSVLQSSSIDRYLSVTKPVDGIPMFPSMAGAFSGDISVTASGPWTATIYLEGFSFYSGQEKTVLAQNEATDNKFKIWTISPNTDTKARQGVLVVSLDEDPDNFSSAIVFSQKAPGGITIYPESEMVFTGAGAPVATDIIDVYPSYTDNGEGQNPRYELDDWNIQLYEYNTTTPYSGSRFNAVIAQKTLTMNTAPGTAGINTVKVTTNGANNNSLQARATLRIYLNSDPSKYTDITLTQKPQSLKLNPGSVPALPVTGGETQLITVQGDDLMKWKAEISMYSGSASDGRTLINHYPAFTDQNGNTLDMTQPQAMTTRFRTVMPKVYWPNREISDIQVCITVELLNADGTPTGVKANVLTVNQNSLVSKGFRAWDVYTNGWGTLTSGTYMTRFNNTLRNRWPGFTLSGSYIQSGTNVTTYIHMGGTNFLTMNHNWSTIEDFRTGKDGVFMIVNDNYENEVLSVINSPLGPLNKNGYTIVRGTGENNYGLAVVNDQVSNTRIYQFLMEHGGYVKAPQRANTGTANGYVSFNMDGYRTEAVDIPETAVPILYHRSTGRALLTIDPANKLIYLGEGQLFDIPAYTASMNTYGHGYGFMCNFIHYLENAAKYGSHFTDMLRDSLDETQPTPPANPIPTPWDDVWGNNKWIEGPGSTSQ